MTAIIKEDERVTRLTTGQSTNGVLNGEQVIIGGLDVQSGFHVIFPGPHSVGYIPGAEGLPLILDNGVTVDAEKPPEVSPFDEPML